MNAEWTRSSKGCDLGLDRDTLYQPGFSERSRKYREVVNRNFGQCSLCQMTMILISVHMKQNKRKAIFLETKDCFWIGSVIINSSEAYFWLVPSQDSSAFVVIR